MVDKYDDIINTPHWDPKNHQRMPMENRASQFAPFAALVGHDEAIRETARITDDFIDMDTETARSMNEKINLLLENIRLQQEIEVTYFVKDINKDGGSYAVHKGIVRRFDEVDKVLIFVDGYQIPLSSLSDLRGPLFTELDNRI